MSRFPESTPISVAPRLIGGLLFALCLVTLTPRTLAAHAVVLPKAAATGAYERYVLRVPNEKAIATTRIELRIPAGLRVTSFADVPGWQLEVLTDSAKRIIGAVWTGTLAPQRFVELPFVAANPKSATKLSWPAFQTYADGERVEWTGAEGSRQPASSTTISAPGGGVSAETWIAGTALLVSLVSLGLALRPMSPRGPAVV